MAKILGQMQEIVAAFEGLKTRTTEDTANLKNAIASLQSRVTELEAQLGETTPEVQTVIDQLKAEINNLDPDPDFPALPVEPPGEPPVE